MAPKPATKIITMFEPFVRAFVKMLGIDFAKFTFFANRVILDAPISVE